MPQFLAPGVYIEEVPGPKPIESVGTATGAFVGLAEKGPIGEARLITNWTQFVETYGGFMAAGYLAYAVNQFFTEGGTRCYVVRTCHYDYTSTLATHLASTGTITLQDTAPSPAPTFKVDAASPGSWSDHLWVEIGAALKDPTNKFRLVVWYRGKQVEEFEELTKGNAIGIISGGSKYIKINHDSTGTPPSILPPRKSAFVVRDRDANTTDTIAVTALNRGLVLAVFNQTTTKFTLLVAQAGAVVDSIPELSLADVEQKINGVSKFIKVQNLRAGFLPQGAPVTLNDRAGTPQATLAVIALAPGLTIDIADPTTPPDLADTFRLVVKRGATTLDTFTNLTMATVENRINGVSPWIQVRNLNSTTIAPTNRPTAGVGTTLNDPLLLPRSTSVSLNDRAGTPQATLAVIALAPGLTIDIANPTTPPDSANTFRLVVKRGTTTLDTFTNLTMATVENRINGVSPWIQVRNLNSTTTAPTNQPAAGVGTALVDPHVLPQFGLDGGDDGLADGLMLKDSTAPTPANALLVNAFREQLSVQVDNATSGAASKFKLTILVKGVVEETFDELVMNTVEQAINGTSQFIEVVRQGTNLNRPNTLTATVVPTGLADMDFIGDAATKNGLHAFDAVDDINILAIPDRPGDREVIIAAYSYCQNRTDCFFVGDPSFGLDPQAVLAFKEGTGIFAGNAFNSSYSALYYPWISVTDPITGGTKFVPPSGAVAGTYSGTDVLRGVHKAPAGTIDGNLNSAVGIERLVTKGEQELLNPNHINVIRSFPGAGIVVWGARTLSADPEFRYVNVRRLLLFIEESLEEGTQWVVFEPNERSLWSRLKRDITEFLTNVWRSGALFGSVQDEAFTVKIDDENNPPEVRNAGQLVIDIAVAPVNPAEFVRIRITQRVPANRK